MVKQNKFFLALRLAFPLTLPVLTGFLVLGMAYGILMSTKGYGVLWSFLMSALAFCGSMQFVAITLLTTMFHPLYAFFLSLMVNARHLFYGITMLEQYKGLGKLKYFLVFLLCDETFSITSSATCPNETDPKWFYFWISFLDYLYWIGGTILGALLGNFIRFNTTGLDFVLTALFIVILLGQLEKKQNQLPAFLGIGCSVLCLLLFGPNNFIIPSMCSITLLLTALRPKLSANTKKEKEERSCI